jgi:hypothetical protein
MANRSHYPVQTLTGNALVINLAQFTGNGSSSPTAFSDLIDSVTRTGAGTYDVVFTDAYPTEVCPMAYAYGATAGLQARVSAWVAQSKTMTVVTETAGASAGSAAAWTSGVAVTAHAATLASAGFVTAVHATTQDGIVPVWTSGVVVASHTVTLAFAGYVTAVEATTADSTGVTQVQFSAAPAQGFVRVEYSAAGVATLTFNATDNVTACAVQVVRPGVLHQGKRIISTGTPQPGEVKVEYTAGVATLTFATADNVTVAAVTRIPAQTATTSAATDATTSDFVVIQAAVRNSSYARP